MCHWTVLAAATTYQYNCEVLDQTVFAMPDTTQVIIREPDNVDISTLSDSTGAAFRLLFPLTHLQPDNSSHAVQLLVSQARRYTAAIGLSILAAQNGSNISEEIIAVSEAIKDGAWKEAERMGRLQKIWNMAMQGHKYTQEALDEFTNVRGTLDKLFRDLQRDKSSNVHLTLDKSDLNSLQNKVDVLEEFSKSLSKYIAWWNFMPAPAKVLKFRTDQLVFNYDSLNDKSTIKKWKEIKKEYSTYNEKITNLQSEFQDHDWPSTKFNLDQTKRSGQLTNPKEGNGQDVEKATNSRKPGKQVEQQKREAEERLWEVEKPHLGKRGAEQADQKRPEAEKQQVGKRAVEQAEQKKPEAEKPVEQAGQKRPEAGNQQVGKRAAEQADQNRPEAEKQQVGKRAVEQAEQKKPEAEKPVEQAGQKRPEAGNQQFGKRVAEQAEQKRSEAEKQQVEKPVVEQAEQKRREVERERPEKSEQERAEDEPEKLYPRRAMSDTVEVIIGEPFRMDLITLAESTVAAFETLSPLIHLQKSQQCQAVVLLIAQAQSYVDAINFSIVAAQNGFTIADDILGFSGSLNDPVDSTTEAKRTEYLQGMWNIAKRGEQYTQEAMERFKNVRARIHELIRDAQGEISDSGHPFLGQFDLDSLRNNIDVLEKFSESLSKYIGWWNFMSMSAKSLDARSEQLVFNYNSLREKSIIRSWKETKTAYSVYNKKITLLQNEFKGYDWLTRTNDQAGHGHQDDNSHAETAQKNCCSCIIL